jgi:hypothetical protein
VDCGLRHGLWVILMALKNLRGRFTITVEQIALGNSCRKFSIFRLFTDFSPHDLVVWKAVLDVKLVVLRDVKLSTETAVPVIKKTRNRRLKKRMIPLF